MRAIKSAIVILLLSAITVPAFAGSEVTQLTAANMDRQHSFVFDIKTEKKYDGIHFTLTITAKPIVTLSPILEGSLSVMDGQTAIATVPVDGNRVHNTVTYEFTVAEKVLEKSTFNFGNMGVSKGKPQSSGDFYWFYLKDVMDPK